MSRTKVSLASDPAVDEKLLSPSFPRITVLACAVCVGSISALLPLSVQAQYGGFAIVVQGDTAPGIEGEGVNTFKGFEQVGTGLPGGSIIAKVGGDDVSKANKRGVFTYNLARIITDAIGPAGASALGFDPEPEPDAGLGSFGSLVALRGDPVPEPGTGSFLRFNDVAMNDIGLNAIRGKVIDGRQRDSGLFSRV